MENIGNDEAAKEAKILALAASLKDHREALHFIPEIFEQFTALQSNEYKATLIEKEKKDLEQKVESLLYDIEVKGKRIAALGQQIEAITFKDRQFLAFTHVQKNVLQPEKVLIYLFTLLVETLQIQSIAALKKQLEARTFTNQQSFTGDRGSRPSSSLGKDAGNHSATFRIIEKDVMRREKDEKIMMLEKKLEAAKVEEERKRELISSLERQLETMKSTRDLLETRISSLERQLETMKSTRDLHEKRSPDTQAQERSIQAMKDRFEEMKHELHIKDQKLKEKEEKYDELNHVLNTKDQELKDEKDKFLLREKEYISVIHNKDRDIEQTKLRYEELNRELNSKDQKLKEKNDKFQQLQKEYNSTIQNKDSDIERMKIRINELEQEANSALRRKDREIEQLKSRIASISEKKVRQDQSRVENTLSMNRQSKVEEDFKLFVDEARMDACDRIQSLCKSNEDSCVRIYYPRLACLIFEAAYEQTKQAKHAFGEICKDVSSCLIHSAPNLIHHFLSFRKKRYPSVPITLNVSTSRQEMEYPTDVVDAFLLSLKESATAHNVTFCVTDVQNSIRQKWHSWFQENRWFKPDEKIIGDPQILSYIEKCIMLTWRMVTQVPAMTLEYQSKYLESDFHTVIGHRSRPTMYNNTASEKEEIALYIWPVLCDGRGTVIRRGDVICKVAK